ncbi:alpha/beta fold hydrolase [Burkholderia guangdongensis]|uniref:alpha/beta fold hydrolase n=1 Tax=Burkholderia guangdongensis TaxID=1792500 RepID=UPI0015CD14F2|nr:alpha/beta fold hydrolase [Burkholderia guangdongensis]
MSDYGNPIVEPDTVTNVTLANDAGQICVHRSGDAAAPAIVMAHSILSSSAMWAVQAEWLVARGWQVLRLDARGHGASLARRPPNTMSDLVSDTVAVLDALGLEKVHYIGLSLGGMSGFGLALHHAERLHSLCLCDARADAPPDVAAPWNDRIEIVEHEGCEALADSTLERWFGREFLERSPVVAASLREIAASTSTAGFIGCARAIQGLDYLHDVDRIEIETTLIVGENDGVLPAEMAKLASRMPRATLEVIAGARHLPNIDQPGAFNRALLGHFERIHAKDNVR